MNAYKISSCEVLNTENGIVITMRPACRFLAEGYQFVKIGGTGAAYIRVHNEADHVDIIIPADLLPEMSPILERGEEIMLVEYENENVEPMRELILARSF